MGTLFALIGIFGAGAAYGYAMGSKHGFDTAVVQLEKIVKIVEHKVKDE
jgi:hypothetical protein